MFDWSLTQHRVDFSHQSTWAPEPVSLPGWIKQPRDHHRWKVSLQPPQHTHLLSYSRWKLLLNISEDSNNHWSQIKKDTSKPSVGSLREGLATCFWLCQYAKLYALPVGTMFAHSSILATNIITFNKIIVLITLYVSSTFCYHSNCSKLIVTL